jgi:hypothetical protein
LQKLLKAYQKRLTNLSANNKALLLLRLADKYFLDLHELDFVQNKPSFHIIESLIAKKTKITLCSNIDSRDDKNNKIANILHKIQRTDKLIIEERGAKNLYVGYPFVQGKLIDDTLIRCPLLFFPVELVLENNNWTIKIIENQPITWNITFLLAYAHYNQVQIEESFLDFDFEELGNDAQSFLTQLYRILEQSPIDLHFNQENFANTLHYFKTYTKKDFTTDQQTGKLRLMPEAVLGVFPLSDSYLMPDYEVLLAHESQKTLEELLTGSAKQNFSFAEDIPKIKEKNLITPYPLDASQEAAMLAVKSGKSIVVQGPPGTGKSQLICNLISDNLAEGKKVLVVCQKRAALDVVHKRLAEKNIGTFAALVHDIQADRAKIFEQLQAHIENLGDYRQKNEGFDMIYAANRFEKLSEEIEKITTELDLYKQVLFDTSRCGLAVKELYLTNNKEEKFIYLPDFEEHKNIFHFNFHQNFLQQIDLYGQYANKLDFLPDNLLVLSSQKITQKYDKDCIDFWQLRKSFASYHLQDKYFLLSLLPKIGNKLQAIHLKINELLNKEHDFANFFEIEKQLTKIKNFADSLDTEFLYLHFKKILPYQDIDLKWFAEIEKNIYDCFDKPNGIEKSLEQTADFDWLQTEIAGYEKAQTRFFSKIHWKFFAKNRKKLTQLAAVNSLKLSPETAKILLAKIQNRQQLETFRTNLCSQNWLIELPLQQFNVSIENIDWLADIPQSVEKQDFIAWFLPYQKAFKAKKQWKNIAKVLDKMPFSALNFEGFQHHIQALLACMQEFRQEYDSWLVHFSAEQIAMLFEQKNNLQTGNLQKNNLQKNNLQKNNLQIDNLQMAKQGEISNFAAKSNYFFEEITAYLDKNFDLLCEFDLLQSKLQVPQKQLLTQAISEVSAEFSGTNIEKKAHNFEEVKQICDNSIRQAWIASIEAEFPILRAASPFKIAQWEQILQRSVIEKRQVAKDLLLQNLREQTYNNLTINRLGNRTTYRDLKHQVSKKRYVFPLRKLIEQFREEIFRLLPCWLASPETTSALFEMTELFDLVIFDEASQCYAEKGIPALYRGKQTVIAGDDKQLAPFDLYRPRWEEDFEEDNEQQTALEVDSLLDLGNHYLTTCTLQEHYRSKSLELIDFSNQVFYQNKLRLIPDIQDFASKEPAISYLKVEGVWQQNSNVVEAQKVASLIDELQQAGNTSIGVITFNVVQQNLILDTLESENIALGADVFVKNIENVQGDERDIIIFSVGYAPSPSGRMVMQFGTLNMEKGENRLNVAITRAKEKIYMVTSIFPHQLEVESLKNQGVKLLQQYLYYALRVSEGSYRADFPHKKEQNSTLYLKEKIKEKLASKQANDWTENLLFADLGLAEQIFLTDDNLFFNSISSKDYFAYLPLQLAEKGWEYSRFWSRAWWAERENLDFPS